MTSRTSARPAQLLLVAGVLLIAANLRPTIVAVGPLLPALREDLALTATAAGLLGAMPLLSFAAVSPLVPRVAHRLGTDAAMLASLVVLGVGTAARSFGGVAGLFAGTLLLAAGIGGMNVLLPVVLKQRAPGHVTALTAAYATVLALAAVVAAGVAVPLAAAVGGWPQALAWSGALVVPALAVWAVQLRRPVAAPDAARGELPAEVSAHPRLPWRDPVAWSVTAFMGLQSMAFYATVAWLPTISVERASTTEAEGGLALVVSSVLGAAASLSLPLWMRGVRDQRGVAVVSALAIAAGWAGLALAPAAVLLWAGVLGAGSGLSFALTLAMFGLRSRDAAGAVALSAMAQSLGYLVAAVAPVVAGALRDLTGGWGLALAVLAGTGVLTAAAGWIAGRDVVVGAPAAASAAR